MTGNKRAPALCLLLLGGFLPASPAQNDFKISTDVNLVVFGASVVDRSGKFVTGLQKENFRVYENGRLQETKLFLPEDVPVTVGLIVDSSGSMRPKMADTITAALSFMRYSNPDDELFVVRFNEKVWFGLPESVPFTNQPAELRDALLSGSADGRTALYDAIETGLRQLERGTRERKILIVFSDGGDNASHIGLRETLLMAERSNAILYTIGLFDEFDRDRNPAVLRRLAKITGGETYVSETARDISSICERIARDIRNQYTIGYAPATSGPSLRAIKVLAETPEHKKLNVRARTGYVAPTASSAEARP